MNPTAAYYIASPVLVSANPPMDTKLSSPVDPYTLVMILFSYLIYYHMHWKIGKFWYGDPTMSYVDSAFLFYSIVNLEGVKMRNEVLAYADYRDLDDHIFLYNFSCVW